VPNREELEQQVATLLKETAEAHHQAFASTGGADPDWALWYAAHLQDRLPALLGVDLTQTKICRLLAELDEEHQTTAPDDDWAGFYARHLVERLATSAVRDDLGEEKLALYHFPGCPFCVLVRAEIDRLGVDVELRDIHADPRHRDDLVAARGRATVPVLRCTGPSGDRWMPESRDIVAYLRQRFG